MAAHLPNPKTRSPGRGWVPAVAHPAVSGKKRCRMHGGAKGSGAPKNNQNAVKHGTYTKEAFQQRAKMREIFREAKKLLNDIS